MKTALEMYLAQVYPEWRTKHQIEVALGIFDTVMGHTDRLRSNELGVEMLNMMEAETLQMGSKGFRLRKEKPPWRVNECQQQPDVSDRALNDTCGGEMYRMSK